MWRQIDTRNRDEFDKASYLYELGLPITDRVNERQLLNAFSDVYTMHSFWSDKQMLATTIICYLPNSEVFHVDLIILHPLYRKGVLGTMLFDSLVNYICATFMTKRFQYISFEACPFIKRYAMEHWKLIDCNIDYLPMFTTRKQSWMMRPVDIAGPEPPKQLMARCLQEWLDFQSCWETVLIKRKCRL